MATLRAQLSSPETIQDFTAAAEDRYWAGVELLVAGQLHTGVYLLGIAAEIWVKRAVFLFDGHSPTTTVHGLLAPVRVYGRATGNPHDPESYHSVAFWIEVLRNKRAAARPLSAALDGELTVNGAVLHDGWKIDMRYRAGLVSLNLAHEYMESVSWLEHRKDDLWS